MLWRINNVKSGQSKIDGCSYKFEYINDDQLPDNYKKSANIRPKRVSDDDKKKNKKDRMKRWQQKEFICQNCNNRYKNGYRYLHKKKCVKSE